MEWRGCVTAHACGAQGVQLLDERVFAKDKGGRVQVDEQLRVLTHTQTSVEPDIESSICTNGKQQMPAPGVLPCVYALGDCAAVQPRPYAATAQVAEQQGKVCHCYSMVIGVSCPHSHVVHLETLQRLYS